MPELMTKARLQRRYDAVMKTLRELMNSKSEKVKLTATLRYAEILAEHDRSVERVAIATERATARKATANQSAQDASQATAGNAGTDDDEDEAEAQRRGVEDLKRMVDAMLDAKVDDEA